MQPFPTINHALNAIEEFGGDTIIVNDGTYNESIHVYGPNDSDYLTIESINSSLTTIIDAPNADQGVSANLAGSSITIGWIYVNRRRRLPGAGGMIKEFQY